MAIPQVETLYQCAEVLSKPGVKFNQNRDKYETILTGVKGSDQAKRLASQFIARFSSKFPDLSHESLDAILDLCEDDDVDIRKQAIKDLPMLCRETKEFLPKIADVLSQLLQTDDSGELTVIQNSLVTLFRKDAKGTLIGLFSQIKNGGDLVRERAINFLHLKVKTEGSELLNKQAENILIQEIKGTLCDCSADEFKTFMSILCMTNLPNSVTGQADLADTAMVMAELEKPFDARNKESVNRLVQCGETATNFFSARVRSTKFFQYICLSVLPHFAEISQCEAQTRILKLLATFACNVGTINQPIKVTENIYNTLLMYMPLPPENVESLSGSEASEFEFTKVECLLFTFHAAARHAPEFLTNNSGLLKDFRLRLQYFARGNQGCMKKLKEFLENLMPSETKSNENRIKVLAYKSTSNIALLIKDLFHSPPSYKAKIVLSWKQTADTTKPIKRRSITFTSNSSPKKSNSKIYIPPTGKYSGKLDKFDSRTNGPGEKFRRNQWNR